MNTLYIVKNIATYLINICLRRRGTPQWSWSHNYRYNYWFRWFVDKQPLTNLKQLMDLLTAVNDKNVIELQSKEMTEKNVGGKISKQTLFPFYFSTESDIDLKKKVVSI